MTHEKPSRFRESLRIKLLIGLSAVVIMVLLFPKGESIEFEVTEGTIWIHDDLIAPFSFAILKDPNLYRSELNEAAQSVYPIYVDDQQIYTDIIDSLHSYNEYLLKVVDSGLISDSLENPTFLSSESFRKLKEMRIAERGLLQRRELSISNLLETLETILKNLYDEGVLNSTNNLNGTDSIAVRSGNIDRIEPVSKFHTLENVRGLIEVRINRRNYPSDVEALLIEYAVHFIVPNIVFNEQLTNEEIEQAKANVSQYSGIVNENERIVAKHDRVTKDTRLKIESYKRAKGEKIGEEGFVLQLVGKFIHVSFLISLLTIYLFLFRKKIFYDNQKIILISIIFVFLSFITYLTNQINVKAPVQLLIFIPAASMLLTIIFDSRVGFYSTVILALITGALRGNDYTFTVMNLFAGALSVYTVRDIKNRSQIFRSLLFILVGYVISILAFGFERFASAETLLIEIAFAASNALISPVLTYGLLIFFERSFRITTDLTLLELSNFDRPLLKELARKAPGTFNHSMTMGTIAETAAEKVGANPLLTRVGAYYHDIGKTITPQNFVENQLNNQNVHENLTPEESVKLIIRHVEEGMALAKENNLPKEIIDFIPMHHGTTTISFFYDKARKMYGDEKVNINNYKYPGPKPSSKETAIIMLADGCESAVRSIDNPDPVRVENVIDNIINSRIEEGQLDDSPITFSDITKLKEAFKSILLGQHHRRIRYPKQDEIEKGTEADKENT
ncbi:MAG: HDIG domain-containing protein [Ignavibacteriales bacterium]|nr:MAG: HDIG domain-containing protein [Ignavibacteriales bacterium]